MFWAQKVTLMFCRSLHLHLRQFWVYWPRAFSSELCRSFPCCTELCPWLLETCQLLALSVDYVTGVCESGVTRWQRCYLGEQWAVRHMQAICSVYCVTAQRSNAEMMQTTGLLSFLWPKRPALYRLIWLTMFLWGRDHLSMWSCILSASLDPGRLTRFNPSKRTQRESQFT